VAGGAFWLWRRSSARTLETGASRKAVNRKAAAAKPQAKSPAAKPRPTASPAQNDLLEVLKDELFQLERDRAEGKVPQDQYEKTKAGLDALLRRQLKKMGQG
jgi:hypothetical protein